MHGNHPVSDVVEWFKASRLAQRSEINDFPQVRILSSLQNGGLSRAAKGSDCKSDAEASMVRVHQSPLLSAQHVASINSNNLHINKSRSKVGIYLFHKEINRK